MASTFQFLVAREVRTFRLCLTAPKVKLLTRSRPNDIDRRSMEDHENSSQNWCRHAGWQINCQQWRKADALIIAVSDSASTWEDESLVVDISSERIVDNGKLFSFILPWSDFERTRYAAPNATLSSTLPVAAIDDKSEIPQNRLSRT